MANGRCERCHGPSPSQKPQEKEIHSISRSLITSIWHWILRLRGKFKELLIELYMNNADWMSTPRFTFHVNHEHRFSFTLNCHIRRRQCPETPWVGQGM